MEVANTWKATTQSTATLKQKQHAQTNHQTTTVALASTRNNHAPVESEVEVKK